MAVKNNLCAENRSQYTFPDHSLIDYFICESFCILGLHINFSPIAMFCKDKFILFLHQKIPLHLAAGEGHLETVTYLVTPGNINEKDMEKVSILDCTTNGMSRLTLLAFPSAIKRVLYQSGLIPSPSYHPETGWLEDQKMRQPYVSCFIKCLPRS